MHQDLHGLPLTCASAEAADAFNRATLGYIKYRLDTPQHLTAALTADPGFALAQCLKGYFAMLSYKRANVAAELHVYAQGGHGFGVRKSSLPCSTWTDRCVGWLQDRGMLRTTNQAK